MDGLRAEDQGAHTQHAIESRNDVGNRAPDGEGKIEPQELGHKAAKSKSIHIQHTNKHTDKIRKDKQKKDPER
jgi:hypothetical protein